MYIKLYEYIYILINEYIYTHIFMCIYSISTEEHSPDFRFTKKFSVFTLYSRGVIDIEN